MWYDSSTTQLLIFIYKFPFWSFFHQKGDLDIRHELMTTKQQKPFRTIFFVVFYTCSRPIYTCLYIFQSCFRPVYACSVLLQACLYLIQNYSFHVSSNSGTSLRQLWNRYKRVQNSIKRSWTDLNRFFLEAQPFHLWQYK